VKLDHSRLCCYGSAELTEKQTPASLWDYRTAPGDIGVMGIMLIALR
jgi:hypothetical protein